MDKEQLDRFSHMEINVETIAQKMTNMDEQFNDIHKILTGNGGGYKSGLLFKVDEAHEKIDRHTGETKKNKDRNWKMWTAIIISIIGSIGSIVSNLP